VFKRLFAFAFAFAYVSDIYVWLNVPVPGNKLRKLRLRFTLTLMVNNIASHTKIQHLGLDLVMMGPKEKNNILSAERLCMFEPLQAGKDLKFILYCFRLPFLLLLEKFGSSEVNDWVYLSEQIILPRIFMHGS
jgi:hypothetical protein